MVKGEGKGEKVAGLILSANKTNILTTLVQNLKKKGHKVLIYGELTSHTPTTI